MTLLQAFVLMVGTLVIWGVHLALFRRMVRNECALLLADLDRLGAGLDRISDRIHRLDLPGGDDEPDGPAPG